MDRVLRDKKIVITGGTKGVGRELVRGLTQRGAIVIFGARDEKAALTIIDEVHSEGNEAFFVRTDLKVIDDIKNLFDTAEERCGRIDGYINYSGISPISSILECDEKTYDEVFDVNFKAAFFGCKFAIKAMLKNGGGSIVLTGSPHAWGGAKNRAAYSCSKGALISLMEHIAHNYSEDMIRCNYMTLGWTLTDGEIELRRKEGLSKEQFLDYALPLIPMKHMSKPDEYTEAYAFLLSDASKYMTGTIMQMTSGLFI